MNILVGVTGSIAAYKSIDLVHRLVKNGHNVQTVMTENAKEFVTPLTLETMSNNIVVDSMFDKKADPLAHINLAKWADVCVIAPADANIIAKIAHGIADDFLTTLILAFDGPVLVAPAMNTVMYRQKVTQTNLEALKSFEYSIIEPEEGLLACGDTGSGKLAGIDKIIYEIEKSVIKQSLKGKKIIVTGGPTVSPIDPVRYITNHSSGKMGFAIAQIAAMRGADVTLVAGKVNRATPFGVQRIDVETTNDMKKVLEDLLPRNDALIMAAAPADFSPETYSEQKIKKSSDKMILSLKKNDDILKSLKPLKQNKIIVGFAAESENLLENASTKLKSKGLDFIVANNIAGAESAFQSDYNAASLIFSSGKTENVERQLKTNLADKIIDEVEALLKKQEDEN